MCSFLQFLKCLFFLKSDVMHLNIVVRLGNKVAKAGAYQNHGLKMTKKIVMMAPMKKVLAVFSNIALSPRMFE